MRVFLIKAFVFCFTYLVIPMCTFFSLVSALSLSVYSFKIFLFLVRGSFAMIGTEPLPQTLLVSPIELVVAGGIMVASAIVYFLFHKFSARQKEERKEERRRLKEQQRVVLPSQNDFSKGDDIEL